MREEFESVLIGKERPYILIPNLLFFITNNITDLINTKMRKGFESEPWWFGKESTYPLIPNYIFFTSDIIDLSYTKMRKSLNSSYSGLENKESINS